MIVHLLLSVALSAALAAEPAAVLPVAPPADAPVAVAPAAPGVAPADASVDAPVAVPAVEAAARTEMERAIVRLRLPDAPAPYLFLLDVLDGHVATAFAEGGVLVSADDEPYRNVRTEVRVGDYAVDSSNFSAFGEPEGVVSRRLPVEDDAVALRREIWLATDEAYKHAVEQFSRKQAARRGDTSTRAPDFAPAQPLVRPFAQAPARKADAGRMERLAERLSAEAGKPGPIEVAQAIARDWQGRRLVLNSEGTRAWLSTGFVVVRVEATTRLPDGTELTDARSWVARDPDLLPPEEEMIAETREMAEWLVALRDAPVEEDYLGPVLFEGEAAVELFSQLLAAEIVGTPPMEQDGEGMAQTARAPVARPGRRLLPTGWGVVDDPTAQEPVAGAYVADHEGVAAQRVELVEDGVLRDVLMSRIPRKDVAGSNGHGRALGNDRRGAMPAVVTVSPDRTVSERRLRRAGLRLAAQTGRDYLLVVRRIVPPALVEDLEVSFSGEGPPQGLTPPYEAYRLYADGHTQPVRSLTFSGVDRRVLRDVALAAEGVGPVDVLDGPPGPGRFQIGATGGLPVTWDVPAVLVAELELNGGGGGEPRVLAVP